MEEGWVGWGEIICLSLHCHYQNDSRGRMGSDESHIKVSLLVRDKSHKTVSVDHTTFSKRKESRSGIEPRVFCLPA